MEKEGRLRYEDFNPRKDEIISAVIGSRESFVNSSDRSRAKAYDPEFDRQSYLALSKFRDKYPQEYAAVKKDLDAYTRLQVETLIGERLNVTLSVTEHEIRDGVIYNKDANEPLINMFIRGRDYRRKHGNPVDWKREDAEIAGFEKIQKVLCSPAAPLGTIMLSISPPGMQSSDYKQNFYDAITVKERAGKRYIEAKRYSSNLSIEEYFRSLRLFTDPGKEPESELAAVYLLSNPFRINGMSADRIHEFLHREHNVLSTEEFTKVIEDCQTSIGYYLGHLAKCPQDDKIQHTLLDGIMNFADAKVDEVSGKIVTRNNDQEVVIYPERQLRAPTLVELYQLGHRKVRETTTGCGSSAGFSEHNPFENPIDKAVSSPSSVADFGVGENKYGIGQQEWFKCPNCEYKADGPVGNKCPGCNLTKEDYAQQGNKVC